MSLPEVVTKSEAALPSPKPEAHPPKRSYHRRASPETQKPPLANHIEEPPHGRAETYGQAPGRIETAMHLRQYQGRRSLHCGRTATIVTKTGAFRYHAAPRPGHHRSTQVRPRADGHPHHRPGRRQPRPRATAAAASGHSPAVNAMAAPRSRLIRIREGAADGPSPRRTQAGERKQPHKSSGLPSEHPHRCIRGSPRVTTSP